MASGRKGSCAGRASLCHPRSTSCSEQPPVKADKLDRTGQGWTGLEGAGFREGGACSKECTDVKIPGKREEAGRHGSEWNSLPGTEAGTLGNGKRKKEGWGRIQK